MKKFIFISFIFLLSCDTKEQVNSSEKPTEEQTKILPCPGEDCCEQSQECKQKCESLFLEWENKQKCFQEFATLVERMHKLMTEVFHRPNEDNLVNVNLSTLQSVLAISEKAWLVRINNYSKRHARATLFWLASKSEQDIFSYSDNKEESLRLILVALLRQNAHYNALRDDNALLSGLKEPVTEKEKHFFEVANRADNISLMSHAHQQIVASHLCDYQINHPKPASRFYTSDDTYPACVLAVYCHITGSYSSRGYSAHKKGQALRKDIAGELMESEIKHFIEADYQNGGLAITDNSEDWTDSACEKLSEMWKDGNLKFGL